MEDGSGIGTGKVVKRSRLTNAKDYASAHGLTIAEYKRWISDLRCRLWRVKYYARNKERLCAYQKRYWAENKEAIKNKDYYKTRIARSYDKIREQDKERKRCETKQAQIKAQC